jgi:hypothetical protein
MKFAYYRFIYFTREDRLGRKCYMVIVTCAMILRDCRYGRCGDFLDRGVPSLVVSLPVPDCRHLDWARPILCAFIGEREPPCCSLALHLGSGSSL